MNTAIFQTRFRGHEITINETRVIFMAHELHKGCSYYIEENAASSDMISAYSDTLNTCVSRLKELRDTQKSTITLSKLIL